jgi:hypothetical protein
MSEKITTEKITTEKETEAGNEEENYYFKHLSHVMKLNSTPE